MVVWKCTLIKYQAFKVMLMWHLSAILNCENLLFSGRLFYYKNILFWSAKASFSRLSLTAGICFDHCLFVTLFLNFVVHVFVLSMFFLNTWLKHFKLKHLCGMMIFCKMTIYIPFILFKSNRVWFENYNSEISFVS